MTRWLGLLACVAVVAGCTERLTTPGSCPTFCPGGQTEFRDTVLTPIQNGDSSFTGYVGANDLLSLLVSSGGAYGQGRGVIRFLPRGDSVLVQDTARTITVDSVQITVGIQHRDTTQANFVLDLFRVPLSVDTLITVAALDAQLTPDRLLKSTPLSISVASGTFSATLSGADLAKVAFTANDSGRLQVALRVRADAPTAARIGTSSSGQFAPTFTTWVHVGIADTTLQEQSISRIADRTFAVRNPSAASPADLLVVGGDPVARSFLRFALPAYLRDSATIIRATLDLETDAPLFGIPADSTSVLAQAVLTDFGAKSPVTGNAFAFGIIAPGTTRVSLEVGSMVQLWQGRRPLPSIIRLALGSEGSTFLTPRFRSTRSVSGTPTLRITYRRSFAFEGF